MKLFKQQFEGFELKRLLLLFLFVGMLGAISYVDRSIFPTTYQTLQNGGFEQSRQYWSASGGNFVTSTGSPLFGNAYGSWDASASSQTLCSNSVTVPLGLANTNGEAFIYSTGTVAYTHTLEVRDGSGNTLASTSLVNSPTLDGYTAAKTSLNFLFPANTESIRLCVVSQTNEPGIKLDGAYLGSSTNVGTVAQARFYGSLKYARTAGCKWTATGTGTPANPSADTDCPSPTVTGGVTAPSTKIPAVRLQNAPPGTYHFVARGRFGAESADRSTYRFSDGTNTSDSQMCGGGNVLAYVKCPTINGTFTYTTAQSDITVTIQLSAVSSGADSVIDASSTDGGSTQGLAIDVFYYPNADQSVYATDQSDYGPTSYGTTSDFTGFGTVSGINMYHWRVGSILHIMGTFTTGTTTATEARIALPAGLTTESTLPTLSVAGTFNYSNNSATTGYILAEASKSYLTVGYQGSSSYSLAKKNGNDFLSSTVHSFRASVPISGWATTNRAPQLINSVVTQYSGVFRTERALLNCDASSSIVRQFGSWVSSIGNISSGTCTITLVTGIFSAAPICTTIQSSSSATQILSINESTITATNVEINSKNGAGTNASATDYYLECTGPK